MNYEQHPVGMIPNYDDTTSFKFPPHKFCPDALKKRKRELFGKSRDTECIIDADELARIVRLQLKKQMLQQLQKEIENEETELQCSAKIETRRVCWIVRGSLWYATFCKAGSFFK